MAEELESAFPQRAKGDGGMSLRDYFAGQALVGLLGAFTSDDYQKALRRGVQPSEVPKMTAIVAYGYADAMLEERKDP